jgi:hypothetical protein
MISSPSQTPPAPPGADRRRYARTSFGEQATIILCDLADRTPTTVRIRDVSPSGLGITHATRLPNGQRFIAVLPAFAANITRGVLCTVVYSSPAAEGGFHIGTRINSLVNGRTANSKSTATAGLRPAAARTQLHVS